MTKLSGDKASIYSILTEDCKGSFWDRFIDEHKGDFTEDLMNIIGRLKSIGSTVGALETYFKLDEGLEWNDLVCALYDIPDKHLRLYCIRLNENIIVVGNGGPKVNEMMHYSKIIRAKLENGSLVISENGLRLEGNLMLTR